MRSEVHPDFRVNGNISPHPFKPTSRRTLASREKAVLVDDLLDLQVQMGDMTQWATDAVEQIRFLKDVMAQVRRSANATIKAYEEAFDAKDAQIEALTAALVATRKKPATRVEVEPNTELYVRTDYR